MSVLWFFALCLQILSMQHFLFFKQISNRIKYSMVSIPKQRKMLIKSVNMPRQNVTHSKQVFNFSPNFWHDKKTYTKALLKMQTNLKYKKKKTSKKSTLTPTSFKMQYFSHIYVNKSNKTAIVPSNKILCKWSDTIFVHGSHCGVPSHATNKSSHHNL